MLLILSTLGMLDNAVTQENLTTPYGKSSPLQRSLTMLIKLLSIYKSKSITGSAPNEKNFARDGAEHQK